MLGALAVNRCCLVSRTVRSLFAERSIQSRGERGEESEKSSDLWWLMGTGSNRMELPESYPVCQMMRPIRVEVHLIRAPRDEIREISARFHLNLDTLVRERDRDGVRTSMYVCT